MQNKDRSYHPPAPAPRKPVRKPFGAPYGNTSSYTPASDLSTAPFVPSADCYSPPARDAQTAEAEPTLSPDSETRICSGGGSFDGGGASRDWS